MSDALELAKRALQHFSEGSTDRAPSQMRIPLTAYTDEPRFQVEREAVFFDSPIAVALSLELPEPGDFQTQTVMDVPLLLTRDRNATAHCLSTYAVTGVQRSAFRKKVIKRGLAAPTMRGPITTAASWWAYMVKRALGKSTERQWD